MTRLDMTDSPLSPDDVAAIARTGATLVLSDAARGRIQAAHAVVEDYAARQLPVYGLTTALGANADTRLDAEEQAAFQRRVADGRSVGVGPLLPRETVRAMMAARISGMIAGGSGVSWPACAALLDALNAGIHPAVPALGSIGAGDLAQLAHLARGLMGYGMVERDGELLPADQALRAAGLDPLPLAARDGHALVAANSYSVGLACLVLADVERLFDWSLVATALALEGFRANLSILDARALAARPAFGQIEAGARLRALLAGSALWAPGAARRLQDPLSYRCVPQVLGALLHAIREAREAVRIELASSGDNPVVLADDGVMLSQGNFDLTAFVLSWERLGQALTHVATGTAHRTLKMMSAAVSELPRYLTPLGPAWTGFGALQKTIAASEALIRHLAQPISLGVMAVSDGIEDQASMAPAVVAKVSDGIAHLRHLVAIELIVAAQAIELRGVADRLGGDMRAIQAVVRSQCAPLGEDRPLGPEVSQLAEFMAAQAVPRASGV
ncbi:HAL/PAL/TAL family ammonia-lyase [Sphingomonas abietis]|uniref:Aromatic amino acid lyase n=1 Tax=Sphingomonas abietis TaxID=3012344 RepID=A0ABY7NWF0_9SPHN|nr:aromatic amino acid ammonia-lyase [Sphingomonas abietis]WBO23751.1 aromatic amino acid lyase [Sphingomonas abietis]